jgi:hypothetical protein
MPVTQTVQAKLTLPLTAGSRALRRALIKSLKIWLIKRLKIWLIKRLKIWLIKTCR